MNTHATLDFLNRTFRELFSSDRAAVESRVCLTAEELNDPLESYKIRELNHLLTCPKCLDAKISQFRSKQDSNEEVAAPMSLQQAPSPRQTRSIAPGSAQERAAINKIDNQVTALIYQLAREPEGIITLLEEAALNGSSLKPVTTDRDFEIVATYLAAMNFSSAFQNAKEFMGQNTRSVGHAILTAYCALGALVNPLVALKILSPLQKRKRSERMKALALLIQALTLLRLHDLPSGITYFYKTIDQAKHHDFQRLSVFTAKSLAILDTIRFCEGLSFAQPAPSVIKHDTLLAKGREWFNELASKPDVRRRGVIEYLEGFAQVCLMRKPITIHEPSHEPATTRDLFPVRLAKEELRPELQFTVIDFTEIQQVEESSKAFRPFIVGDRYTFSPIPEGYIGRRAYLAILQAKDLLTAESKLVTRDLLSLGYARDRSATHRLTDRRVAVILFQQGELINEPAELCFIQRTTVEESATGVGSITITIPENLIVERLARPDYLAVLVFC